MSMIQLGEGTIYTRRRIALEALVTKKDGYEKIKSILQLYTHQNVRLLTFSSEGLKSASPIVEITHEALVENWDLIKRLLATSSG